MTAVATHKRKKVAIVFQFLPHYRTTVLEQLLANNRNQYFFFADDRDVINKGIPPWKRPEHVAFQRTKTRMLLGHLMWQSGLFKLALRRDIDVIIYDWSPYWPATWISAAMARLLGKRVFFWTIGWMKQDRGLKDWVRRGLYHLANGLLLYGRFGKQTGLEKEFRPDRLYVVFNSLNYPEQKRLRQQISDEDRRRVRAELFEHPERPLLICVSRLGPTRRLDMVLSAMDTLAKQGKQLNLLLVGDGPERTNLEDLARRHKLTVHFYGACFDESTLARLITAANVTVAPGLVGLTAMQSLAYGVPVISHDDWTTQAPEFEAVIPGENGDQFRRDDVVDLTRAIDRWTTTELVPEQVRRACTQVIDRFWNPTYQCLVIEQAIEGEPADDLFWLRSQNTEQNASVDPQIGVGSPSGESSSDSRVDRKARQAMDK